MQYQETLGKSSKGSGVPVDLVHESLVVAIGLDHHFKKRLAILPEFPDAAFGLATGNQVKDEIIGNGV